MKCFILFCCVNLSLGVVDFYNNNYDLTLLNNFKHRTNKSLVAIGLSPNNRTATEPIWAFDISGKVKNSSIDDFNATYLVPVKKKIKCVKHFYLWTRDFRHGSKFEVLNATNSSSVKYSHFQDRQTYIIVHGFLGWGLEGWIIQLKDKLLSLEDCNVIAVDWPAGSSWFLPSYYTACGRVPTVGNDTAILVESLKDYKGLLLKKLHFIGHSLGAHAAGYAIKHFPGRVGRITGLDPAGPYFHKVSPTQRLDRSDAVYVDVIHTNACTRWPYWTDCYGLNENIGHSDFWPNGGMHQPACLAALGSKDQDVTGDIGCDHEIAYSYFIESLNYISDYETHNTSYFLSRPCEKGWHQFLVDNCTCGKKPQFMGINVDTELEGVFFLKTNAFQPYAVHDDECALGTNTNILKMVGYFIVLGFLTICSIAITCFVVRTVFNCLGVECCVGNDDVQQERQLFVQTTGSTKKNYGTNNVDT